MFSKPSSRTYVFIAAGLLIGTVGLVIWMILKLNAPQKVTKGDVNIRIGEEIPLGSTKYQVMAFVDSLEINGFKATRGEYISPYNFGGQTDINGYLGACIKGVRGGFMTWDAVCMMFYFDEQDRLVTYQVDDF
jgi:hypothetical protein